MGKELTHSSNGDNELEAAIRSCIAKIGKVFNAIRNGETELVAKINEDLGLFRRRITISTQHNWAVGRVKNRIQVKGPEEVIDVVNRLLGDVGIASKKVESTVLEIDPFASSNNKFKQFPSSN